MEIDELKYVFFFSYATAPFTLVTILNMILVVINLLLPLRTNPRLGILISQKCSELSFISCDRYLIPEFYLKTFSRFCKKAGSGQWLQNNLLQADRCTGWGGECENENG